MNQNENQKKPKHHRRVRKALAVFFVVVLVLCCSVLPSLAVGTGETNRQARTYTSSVPIESVISNNSNSNGIVSAYNNAFNMDLVTDTDVHNGIISYSYFTPSSNAGVLSSATCTNSLYTNVASPKINKRINFGINRQDFGFIPKRSDILASVGQSISNSYGSPIALKLGEFTYSNTFSPTLDVDIEFYGDENFADLVRDFYVEVVWDTHLILVDKDGVPLIHSYESTSILTYDPATSTIVHTQDVAEDIGNVVAYSVSIGEEIDYGGKYLVQGGYTMLDGLYIGGTDIPIDTTAMSVRIRSLSVTTDAVDVDEYLRYYPKYDQPTYVSNTFNPLSWLTNVLDAFTSLEIFSTTTGVSITLGALFGVVMIIMLGVVILKMFYGG